MVTNTWAKVLISSSQLGAEFEYDGDLETTNESRWYKQMGCTWGWTRSLQCYLESCSLVLGQIVY